MKPTHNEQQWQTHDAHEGEFIQKRIQHLLKKALVTVETTLNDHNLPSTDRLDASLRIIALFQGKLDISHDTLSLDHVPSPESPIATTEVENTSIKVKQAKLSEEELELEELRAVLDHSSSNEPALFQRGKLSKEELELDELRAVL